MVLCVSMAHTVWAKLYGLFILSDSRLKWVYSNSKIYLAWLTISYSAISESFQVSSFIIKSLWLQWHFSFNSVGPTEPFKFQLVAINVSFRPNQNYIRQAVYFPRAINTISASSSIISQILWVKRISFWHILLPKTRFKMTLG